jgi:hypothetical protein
MIVTTGRILENRFVLLVTLRNLRRPAFTPRVGVSVVQSLEPFSEFLVVSNLVGAEPVFDTAGYEIIL